MRNYFSLGKEKLQKAEIISFNRIVDSYNQTTDMVTFFSLNDYVQIAPEMLFSVDEVKSIC